MDTIAFTLHSLFLLLAVIHIYWASGGKWGVRAVIPTQPDGNALLTPGPATTFAVAFGLLCFALTSLLQISSIQAGMPVWLVDLSKIGLWAIALIFTARTIGDFRFVGIFKKIGDTEFARNDTRYFTPLCIGIALLSWILIGFAGG